ncbi:MAG: hypothetical protein IE931_12650 [Sphingobacteriales bacterium]|nr:hypothetical protein [Sphingobacteriales bacterium]
MSIHQTEHLKFLKFHSNPEELKPKDLESLIEWETKYPYCQSLKILAVKASEKTSQQSFFLAQAAASLPDRSVLYRFIHDITSFKSDISQFSEESTTVAPANYEPMETMTAFGINLNEIVGAEFRELSPQLVEEPEEEISSEETQEEVIEETPTEVEVDLEETLSEVEEDTPSEVEEEVSSEEIVEVSAAQEEVETSVEEELVIDSPSQSDFLAYAEKEPAKDVVEDENQSEKEVIDAKEDVVTPYHDERMPYTFLWWLNKTRKEYEYSHQPFAKASASTFKLDTQKEIKKKDTDDLNHQIAEHIFHLRGVEELTDNIAQNTTVPYNFRRKEFQIIDKFIKEEPQIKPPAPNKIDTENKAKKSSEDHGEVVSETLAKIYIEQMLYHKALDVYKKLSLKFPEKSTYFASQIKYLELKVN